MTQQWGAPLTGAQVGMLNIPWGTPCMKGGVVCVIQSYFADPHGKEEIRLPADHIAYTLLKAGWLDKPNVRLWFGGDKAPDDLADGSPVLLQGGKAYQSSEVTYWEWDGDSGDIIAYIAKDEIEYSPPTEKLKEVVRMAHENVTSETVTIAKMTEAEACKWAEENIFGLSYSDAVHCMIQLGLIKETTREERFWAQEAWYNTIEDHMVKAIVKAALEFER